MAGPVDGRWIRVQRTPDPDLSGTGGTGLAEDQSSLNFGELEVFEVTSDAEVKRRLLLEKPLSADSVTQIAELNSDIQTLRDNTPYVDIPMAHAVEDASLYVEPVNDALHEFVYRRGQARDLPIYLRGDPATPGPIVARRFLAVLSSDPPRPFEGAVGDWRWQKPSFTRANRWPLGWRLTALGYNISDMAWSTRQATSV